MKITPEQMVEKFRDVFVGEKSLVNMTLLTLSGYSSSYDPLRKIRDWAELAYASLDADKKKAEEDKAKKDLEKDKT